MLRFVRGFWILCNFVIISIIVLVSSSIFSFVQVPTTEGYACFPSFRGDENNTMIIDEDTVIDQPIWNVTKHITVKSGSELFINNTVVIMNSLYERLLLRVEDGGKLTFLNSTIDGYTETYEIATNGFIIIIEGEIEIENTSISYNGYTNKPQASDQSVAGYTWRWSFEGFIIDSGRADITNFSFYNSTEITANNSVISIKNSILKDDLAFLDAKSSDVYIDGCDIKDTGGGIALTNCEKFEVIDTNIEAVELGIGITNSSGRINNCCIDSQDCIYVEEAYTDDRLFSDEFWGSSEVTISNCRFYPGDVGIYTNGVKFEIINTTFEEADDYGPGIYDYWSAYGIFSEFSYFNLINTSFTDLDSGVLCQYSKFELQDCSLLNTSIGIYAEGYVESYEEMTFTADNMTVKDNEIGIGLSGVQGQISNSVFESNIIGIQNDNSYIVLDSNVIFKSTEWGVVSEGTEVSFSGENFPIPGNWPEGEPTNGFGNLVQLRDFGVYVYDSYDIPLWYVDIKVENDLLELFKDSVVIALTKAQTSLDGYAELGPLVDYVIVEGTEKSYSTDYNITATITLESEQKISNTTVINFQNYLKNYANIKLELPNVYLLEEELELSHEDIKAGDMFTLKTTVHFNGSADFVLSSFDVDFYVSGILIESLQIEGLGGNKTSYNVEFNWQAESGVPYPEQVKKRLVKVEIDLNKNAEYTLGTTRYIDDNSLTVYLNVEVKEDVDKGWVFASGSQGLYFALVCSPIIIILVLIVIFWYNKKRKKKTETEEGAEETEE